MKIRDSDGSIDCRSWLQSEMDLKWVISDEERTRHDALFYSQKPENGYLSGEKARSLFIRSKLPLPDLSKIWKLADVSRNNMLDVSEFAVAMHLIQSRLKGVNIPERLPETLPPVSGPRIEVPAILRDERYAYKKAFLWKDKACTGYIDAGNACSILIGSHLPEHVLARIWNLSDRDRDGKLSLEEFCVAIHLTRFCKKGNSLDGTVDVLSIIPEQWVEENFDKKKHRLAEVQTEKRKLLSLKEKLCHEVAGDVKEAAMAETIKTELYQVERQMYVLEKEENELRRALQQFKDKSKKESFKPFDRSFILKRLPSGEDIFRGAYKTNRSSIPSEKDLEIEKLWKEDASLTDFGVTIKDPPAVPVNFSIRQEQLVTIIELTQGHVVSTESSAESLAADFLPLSNGYDEGGNATGNSNETRRRGVDSTEHTAATHEDRERIQEVRDRLKIEQSDGVTSVNTDGRSLSNGSLPNCPQHTLNETASEPAFSGDSCTSKQMSRNQTDDEKFGSSNVEVYSDYHRLIVENGFEEETFQDKEELDTKSLTLRSSTIRDSERIQGSEAERELLPRNLTQEELISLVQEEKRRKDEERAEQRRVNDEKLQKTQEESLRHEQEVRRLAEQRRATFEEERRNLEHQVSLAQEGQEGKKGPVTRYEAGRIIEQELEEQRIREELTRMELEKIKEKEKLEFNRQKLKQAKKEKQPSSFRNTDAVQKPILEQTTQLETGTLELQKPVIIAKRGSIIELNEAGEESKTEAKDLVNVQPLMRKANENIKPLAGRKALNKKSVVELEIERQKERDEEARRESENVHRSQAQRPSESASKSIFEFENATQKQPEKSNPMNMQLHFGKETSETNVFFGRKPTLRKQVEVDTIVEQRNVTVLESPPVEETDARKKHNNGELQVEKPVETEDESRGAEEEYDRQMEEKERKRREAEKEELYRLRKEVELREAEELMRLKVAREEERRRKREADLKEAAEREKERQEQLKAGQLDAASRKTAFAAHKVILEKRVLKALEERQQEAAISKRRSSSFDRPTDMVTQTESLPPVQRKSDGGHGDDVSAVGVKLRRASFEKRGAQADDLREKKRHSLNLDHARRAMVAREDAASGPSTGAKKDRASLYAYNVVTRESQAQVETEAQLLRRAGTKSLPSNGMLTQAKSLGDVSNERERGGDVVPRMIIRDIPLTGDETDSGFVPADGLPVFADSRIQRELQEQRIREEVLRKEAAERERRNRLEEEKRKMSEPSSLSGKKDVNLNEIKKNPLPNKIVIKKPQGTSNRDSLTFSMAAQWETVLQDGGDVKEKKDKKPSFIELEKEQERLREEELQREREQGLIEKRRYDEEKQLEKQRKIQEELERKRKAKEEKEKRQQRTLAMKSIFEKMGAKK